MPPFLNVYIILDGGGASAILNTANFHINIQRVKTCMTSDAHHSTSLIDVILFFLPYHITSNASLHNKLRYISLVM